MKKRSIVLVSYLLVLFSLSFVSAGIYFSDLDSKYNLGDMVDLNVRVDPIEDGLLLKVSLYCEDDFVIDFNNLPDSDGNVNVKLPLNFNTIDQANGNCYFSGEYNSENRKSMNFEISKLLIVRLNNDAFFANPGEEITISGSAEKLNGRVVDGEVEITIPLLEALDVNEELEEVENEEVDEESFEENASDEEEDSESDEEIDEETEEETESDEASEDEAEEETESDEEVEYDAGTFYGKVVSGDFSVNIKIPDDAPAGDFRVDALVFEEVSGERASEGVSYANLKVFQVLEEIDLSLNNQNFDPGTIIEIRPSLLDQTGVNIKDEVSIIIRGEDGERFYEKIVQSKEGIDYELPTNFNHGTYEIEARTGEISQVRNFFINQKAIAEFELVEDTLIVTNVGNTPYNKGVEIELNGRPFVKMVDLSLGEVASFKLTGSDEEYSVRVSDGDSELTQSGVRLTGRAVDVDAIGEGVSFSSPILWIFAFIILALILIFLFRDTLKKKSFALHLPKRKAKSVENPKVVVDSKGNSVSDHSTKEVESTEVKRVDSKGSVVHNQADQVLVLKGHKSKAAVLVLKIKNKLGENEKQSLERAIEYAYGKKGAVYEQGDYVFAVFSPLMTRVMNNEALASSVAVGVLKSLNEHNKKFKDKIDFGIAINSGEIINKVEGGKLKFTALGNFIVSAKRLAGTSNRQVLLSKESFQKAGSEVKAEKVSDGQAYDLRRVVDSEKNNKFIQGFLDRQKREKN